MSWTNVPHGNIKLEKMIIQTPLDIQYSLLVHKYMCHITQKNQDQTDSIILKGTKPIDINNQDQTDFVILIVPITAKNNQTDSNSYSNALNCKKVEYF